MQDLSDLPSRVEYWKKEYGCPAVKRIIPHVVSLICRNWTYLTQE